MVNLSKVIVFLLPKDAEMDVRSDKGDTIRNEQTRRDAIKSGAIVQENYRKTTQVVRPCEENERGVPSEKNARCAHTREKKKRAPKPRVKRCVSL